MERTISIINIKKHKNTEFKLEDQFIAFIGKNRSGKSTVGQVIQTIMQVKGFMVDPVSHGEEEGEVTYKGEDREGNPIVIKWTTKGGKSNFKATRLDSEGKNKSITGVEEIRKLIGTYCPYSTHDALTMMNSTDGRKKFYNNVVSLCLTPEENDEIAFLDIDISQKRNQDTEGNSFHTRTQKKSDLATKEAIIKQSLSEDEKELLENEEKIKKSLAEMRKSHVEIKQYETLIELDRIEITSIETCTYSMEHDFENVSGLSLASNEAFHLFLSSTIDDIKKFNETIEATGGKIIDIINQYREEDEIEFNIEEVIESGVAMVSKIDTIKESQTKLNITKKEILTLNQDIEKLDAKITDARERKAEIISNSELPAGLTIDEEYRLSLDGFLFDETSTSDSQSKLAMVKLLDKVSTADFIDIGDWSLFDTAAKKEIQETFKGKDRIIIGQLVTEDAEVKTKVIIDE